MNEWCEIIRDAKLTKPIYEVINVTFDMVKDFKDLASKMNWCKTLLKKIKLNCFHYKFPN